MRRLKTSLCLFMSCERTPGNFLAVKVPHYTIYYMVESAGGQDGPILPARGFNHVINGVMRHF